MEVDILNGWLSSICVSLYDVLFLEGIDVWCCYWTRARINISAVDVCLNLISDRWFRLAVSSVMCKNNRFIEDLSPLVRWDLSDNTTAWLDALGTLESTLCQLTFCGWSGFQLSRLLWEVCVRWSQAWHCICVCDLYSSLFLLDVSTATCVVCMWHWSCCVSECCLWLEHSLRWPRLVVDCLCGWIVRWSQHRICNLDASWYIGSAIHDLRHFRWLSRIWSRLLYLDWLVVHWLSESGTGGSFEFLIDSCVSLISLNSQWLFPVVLCFPMWKRLADHQIRDILRILICRANFIAVFLQNPVFRSYTILLMILLLVFTACITVAFRHWQNGVSLMIELLVRCVERLSCEVCLRSGLRIFLCTWSTSAGKSLVLDWFSLVIR